MTTMMPFITTINPATIPCPPLISPANGMAQGRCTNAMPNTQPCFFSCFRGYVLSGFPVLNCQSGGRWSSPAPTCRGITRVPFVPYRTCGVYGCRCRTCISQSSAG
jgi:hypothetical protein